MKKLVEVSVTWLNAMTYPAQLTASAGSWHLKQPRGDLPAARRNHTPVRGPGIRLTL